MGKSWHGDADVIHLHPAFHASTSLECLAVVLHHQPVCNQRILSHSAAQLDGIRLPALALPISGAHEYQYVRFSQVIARMLL
jgi:hypothetical protein